MEISIKDSLIIWLVILVVIFILGLFAGLRILASLALASLFAIVALTTFYPVTNFSSITTGGEEVRAYFVILVITVAFLFLYLCNKILSDRRHVYTFDLY